ncbi:MAG: serine--tRNA ligase [Halieaceae bacterium]|jgi:seryl-tRNA synthetase|nr:serine--tRNA ligase [Halieaceae bacterium]
MLDIKLVRKDPPAVAEALALRGFDFDIKRFEDLDARRKAADISSQQLQAERKSASRKVGELIQGGMAVDEAKASVEATLAEIAARLDEAAAEAREAQTAMDAFMASVPNIPHADVPPGRDEDDNAIISHWGEVPAFDFEVRDHVDVGAALGGIDSDLATKITGSRFTVLSGPVASLHRALGQFMLDLHTREFGCRELNVPLIVNSDSLYGTGQLPKFAEDQFRLEGEQGYYLIPTAEVPVTNIARERIFEDAELGERGLRFVCHSACFRSEAGSYGRDTRGMIRQHQFEKVELVFLVRPEDSEAALETLTAQAETVLQRLGLAYRKVCLCGGDLGFSARKTYDLEVWLPGQQRYREISSCSNFGDFQARRMQARWRNPATGKPELLHTLNGSGLAVGRTLVAVLENYQHADGSVTVPEALRSYLGGLEKIDVG